MDAGVDAPVPRSATVRALRDVPGPPQVVGLGNKLQIRPNRAHLQFESWAERYGPVYRVKLGPFQSLVVSDHALIAGVLRDRPDRFRRPGQAGELLKELGFQRGLFFANDEAWRNQRRMVMAAFAPGNIRAYLPSLLRVAVRLEARWTRAAAAATPIELQADLMRYTVDAVAGLAFGADVDTLSSDEDVIQRHLNRIFPALLRRLLAPLPYWRYVELPADRALAKSVREVQEAIERFVGAARQRLNADPARRDRPGNLLEAMIVAADAEGSGLDDRDVAGNVLTMLLAGEDTTANTLAWLIHLLHRHPAALARVRDEVRAVVPEVAVATMEQLERLPFLDACIHETMRMKPVAPILTAQAACDTIVGDVAVPAGTVIIGLMRRDAISEAGCADPTRFDPDRWLGPAAARPRASTPFGGGPRLCPGRYLALLEMRIAMATLCGAFEIADLTTDDGAAEAREHFSFSMGPSPLRLTLAGRAAPGHA